MKDDGVSDGHLVADARRMRVAHDVNDGPVLYVRAAADANLVDVSANHDIHPDAAVGADRDVANDLRALIDVDGRVHLRENASERPQHSSDYSVPTPASALRS